MVASGFGALDKVSKAGDTMTGFLAPAVVALTFGASIAVNAAAGNVFDVTLTASTGTLANPTNPVDGQVIRVRVTQDATGSRTLAYGTTYDFGAAGAPSLSTAAGATDILPFQYDAAAAKWKYLGQGATAAATGTITLYPAGGSTDDGALITAAFSVAKVVFLVAGQTYNINTTIEIPGGCILDGRGNDTGTGAVLQQAVGANLNAVIASAGWLESSNTTSANPVQIRGVQVKGQSAQSSGAGHGCVLQSFRSLVVDCLFTGVKGDGLRFDVFGLNGTTQISNTMVENRITRCAFRSCGARGFATTDGTTTAIITDGFFTDNLIQNSGTDSVVIGQSAGWLISGNHAYLNAQNVFNLNRPTRTRVINNYVETWGSSATLGTYSGIWMNLAADSKFSSVVAGNCIRFSAAPGNASSTCYGIRCEASGSATGSFLVFGNSVISNQTAAAGIRFENQNSSAAVVGISAGNQVIGFTTAELHTANGGALGVLAGVKGEILACTSYAPGTRTTATVTSTTMAAFSSGNMCTGSFTAPASGSVLVRASFVASNSASAAMAFGLAAVGTVTPIIGNITQVNDSSSTATLRAYTIETVVTGLTPGTAYNFDLLGASASTDTVTIAAQALTSTTPGLTAATSAGPVTMTVIAL